MSTSRTAKADTDGIGIDDREFQEADVAGCQTTSARSLMPVNR